VKEWKGEARGKIRKTAGGGEKMRKGYSSVAGHRNGQSAMYIAVPTWP